MKSIKTEEMNWVDIQEAIANGYKSIIVAVGSIEQHGPHLPTITDTLIGEILAHEVGLKLGNTLQGPTITIGCSEHHLAFSGTVSIRKDTLKAIMTDYVYSLSHHGFENIIFLPSHGGNFQTVEESVVKLQEKYPKINIVCYSDLHEFLEILHKFSIERGKTAEQAGAHAGENETSLVLAMREELVKKDRFTPGFTGLFGKKEGEIVFAKGMKALTENGVLGDPTPATAKDGETYITKLVDVLVDEIKEKLA
ncbi:MAG: creatininase family protein [Asgard group archaeon]|nr:creatininase family protein [Asgard group archaeon]